MQNLLEQEATKFISSSSSYDSGNQEMKKWIDFTASGTVLNLWKLEHQHLSYKDSPCMYLTRYVKAGSYPKIMNRC